MARQTMVETANPSPAARRIMAAADDLFFRQADDLFELLFQLVMRRHLMIAAALDDATSGNAAGPVDQLAAAVGVYAHIHLRPAARRGSRVANREYRGLSEARRAQIVAVRRALRDRIVGILPEGTRQGVFSVCGGSDRASLVVAASTILDMCVHAAEWVREDGPLTIEEIERRFVEMALRLVGAAGAAGAA